MQPRRVLHRAEPERLHIKEEEVDKEVLYFNEQKEQKYHYSIKVEEEEDPHNIKKEEQEKDITKFPLKSIDDGPSETSVELFILSSRSQSSITLKKKRWTKSSPS
ncbi:uncharacterized protein LOC133144035 isoform X2 [Syngnathus typhle]|uniref:uncharacterized protein LOC133144035 isoform X2 n=1 Tax=Syngnathus typhle TaxID=161592 RepID=UPI002A6A50B9|nr:uncharacterized protein LOC133144035 isoform X2 [Syngnathus typhle]